MRRPAALAVVIGCAAGGLVPPASARAQASWDATLIVLPFPSPYLSDWETDPNIATYTLINGTDREQAVVLHYEVRDRAGRVVTAGRSDPQSILPGVPAIYNSLTDIAGSTEHDAALEDQVTRSGRVPEGDYTACIVAAATSGLVLSRVCETFTVVYPDPPMLIGPGDGEVIATTAPIFQWTPLQVPIDFTLHYILQIAEVKPGQTPYTALTSNILHYENLDVGTTSLPYPVDGLPLSAGVTYAWRVMAIDQNGYAAATNSGSSEIWTFGYDDGSVNPPEGPNSSALTLTLMNDPANPAPDLESTGLGEICSEWDVAGPFAALTLPLASRVLFKTDTVPAFLVRQALSDSTRVWAITGQKDPWAYLATGDCDGPNRKTVLRWVGMRWTEEAADFQQWLGLTPDTTAPDRFPRIKFGVGIFSFYAMTATAGEDSLALQVVRDFLDDRDVDVRPGFNGFWVIDGNQAGVLGAIAQALHTTTKDFEIQGFAGMNNQFSVGVSYGGGEDAGLGGDASVQQTFFTARGALPAWEQPWGSDRIKSIQLGLQLDLQDSLSTGLGSASPGSGDFFKKTDLDIVLTATLKVVTKDDITWQGAIGRDWNIATGEAKWLVKLGTDRRWQPGPLAGTDFSLGNLTAEFDAEKLTDLFTEGTGWSLGVGGSLNWGDASIASVGITFGRKDLPTTWAQLVAKDSALILADSTLIESSKAQLGRAEARGDEEAAAAYRQQIADREARLARSRRSLRADRLALEQQERAKQEGRQKPNPTNTPPTPGMWWRTRIAFGNVSLLGLIDLVRKAAAGVAP